MDLHTLPKVRDSWSYLYVEHCKIDQEDKAIAIHDAKGKIPVPCATLTLLMLGPGTSVTHAAIRALAENGCLVMWTGEQAVRFYAQGMGETRKSRRLLKQARLWADPEQRLKVVIRMYEQRFGESIEESLTLRQIRGREGLRVRHAYAAAGEETGVRWTGRAYHPNQWGASDPINRALSCANSCLYGVCHAGIISAGYSPALGFIHTGKMLSFVYDIADLYKTEVTIPVAFKMVKAGTADIETRTRRACRDAFRDIRLLERLVPDIEAVLGKDDEEREGGGDFDGESLVPGGLWELDGSVTPGGVAWGDVEEEMVRDGCDSAGEGPDELEG